MSAKFALVLALIVLPCASALGQSALAYNFFAPGEKVRKQGESVFDMHFGVGARYVSFSGVGLGIEAGMTGPQRSAGVCSMNVYYDLVKGNDYNYRYHGNVQPYVTGGYTRTFGNGNGGNWGNVGVGIAFWAGKGGGLQPGFTLEFRDQIGSQYHSTVHFLTVRLGLGIRGRIYD